MAEKESARSPWSHYIFTRKRASARAWLIYNDDVCIFGSPELLPTHSHNTTATHTHRRKGPELSIRTITRKILKAFHETSLLDFIEITKLALCRKTLVSFNSQQLTAYYDNE